MNRKLIAKRLVRKYLAKAKLYRNNDKILTLQVWQEYGLVLTPKQTALFMRVPDASTIERRRREMRAEFPESVEVEQRRYRRYQEMTDERGSFWKHLFRSKSV